MIELLVPHALWSLAGLALLLWWVQGARSYPTMLVGSLELWPPGHRATADSLPASRPDWYRFLLTGSAYIALVMALSQPLWIETITRRIVIVLDSSASMQTTILPPNSPTASATTVFQIAISRLQTLLVNCDPQTNILLYVYPPGRQYQGSPGQIATQLSPLVPGDLPGTAGSFLRDLVAVYPQTPIYFVSDGADREAIPGQVIPIYCGQEVTGNAGIVACQMENQGGDTRLFITLRNFASQPVTLPLTLHVADRQFALGVYTLPPDRRFCLTQTVSLPAQAQSVRLAIARDDNFSMDNHWLAVWRPPWRLWLPPQSPTCWLRLTQAIPGIQLVELRPDADMSVVPLGVLFPGAAGWLAYGKTFDPASLKIAAFQKVSQIIPAADPLLWATYPELWPAPAACALLAPYPPDTHGLLYAPGGPIMAYGRDWLYFGFSLEATNWPNLPSFPIFWHNYFQVVAPNRNNFNAGTVNLGKERESDNHGRWNEVGDVARPVRPQRVAPITGVPLWRWCATAALGLLALLWWRE